MLAAAVFVPQVVEGIYAGIHRPLPPAYGPLATFWLFMSVAAWFWAYSRAQRVSWVMDMGWFLLLAWVFVVPYYVLRREGRRGLIRIGLFVLAYLAAWALGWATSIWTRLWSGAGALP
jgi:hypothetical protein